MKIDAKAPVVIIKVECFGERGSRILDLIFDTGSTYTMIPWKVAESLGDDPTLSRRRVSIVTASTTEIVPLITIKSMVALGRKVDHVDVACHDLPPKSRVDGLLGLSFLKNFDIDLCFKKGILEIKGG
jgi:aspartyl protease family protein